MRVAIDRSWLHTALHAKSVTAAHKSARSLLNSPEMVNSHTRRVHEGTPEVH